jgi:hypothetical protein
MEQPSPVKSDPFFMTHHSPSGAWSSFTFGLPGQGVSINHESARLENTADFLVALSHGLGNVQALPFVFGNRDTDAELKQVSGGNSQPKAPSNNIKDRWSFINPAKIQRTLTAGVDQFSSEEMTLRVFTPHPPFPDPGLADDESLQFACCPGILLELTVDNRAYDREAHGFMGLIYNSRGRVRPLDWSTEGTLSGIAFSGCWAMAARTVAGKVYTIRDNSIADNVETGAKVVHNGGQEGGILLIVPPGKIETLQIAFGFYHEGTATQTIDSRYYFCRYFNRVEDVCGYILDHAETIRNHCREFDETSRLNTPDPDKYRLFSQAIRAYYANSQLTEAGGEVYYNISEGQYLWRNTMDLAADHLPFELWRHPWVVRNIIDLYIERYSYHDQIRFQDRPGENSPGGLSFTHDMGNYTSFTPRGISGYEKSNAASYHFMTTEELLNGIYCLTAYAIASDDLDWMGRRKPIALELLQSMENRDHVLPEKRNGILKGESLQCGERGREITTYDALDHALLDAAGNLYIAVKTICSSILLREYFLKINEVEGARRAKGMADQTAKALESFFDPARDYFKASIHHETESKVIAAIEPFAVPLFLGLKDRFGPYRAIMALFRKHISSCLQPGECLDRITGGLRLSSTSTNTWISKSILCEFVMDELFEIRVSAVYPTILRELAHWAAISAMATTISDQIQSDTRTVVGASYYPRAITASLWVKKMI